MAARHAPTARWPQWYEPNVMTARAIPVHAYGFAGTLRPKDVSASLVDGEIVRVSKTWALVRLGDQGWVSIHDFGSLVFFDVPDAAREGHVSRVLAALPKEPHPPIVDDFLLEIEEGRMPQATFDRATVGSLDPGTLEVVALVLAQSVAMDYYEEDVQALHLDVETLATELSELGRTRRGQRELSRHVGRMLRTRNQIVMTLSLLDAPADTWEEEPLDRLHRAMRAAFEIDDRYRTLDQKMRLLQDNLEVVIGLAQHRRSAQLEVVVIALIALEIVLAIFERMGKHP